MTSDKTLSLYYIVDAVYDWYFSADVTWDDTFTEGTKSAILKSSSMLNDYSSQAVYSVYDESTWTTSDETRTVYIVNSTSETYTLTGDTTHNNASKVIKNRGSN